MGGMGSSGSSSATVGGIHGMSSGLDTVRMDDNGMIVESTPDGEWTYDPNEPRYCICNQVSYGDMVACDNDVVSRRGRWKGNEEFVDVFEV